MTKNNDRSGPLSLDQIDEDRVRRALGLTSSGTAQQRPDQARQRHRFVADGAVPVVMINRTDHETSGLRDRLAAAEAALDAERVAHAASRRALQELHASHQALQTRSGHAELAHAEALAVEREARRVAEEALASLRQPEPPIAEKTADHRPVLKSRPKREAAKPTREPKPVRWWTPSYRTKAV